MSTNICIHQLVDILALDPSWDQVLNWAALTALQLEVSNSHYLTSRSFQSTFGPWWLPQQAYLECQHWILEWAESEPWSSLSRRSKQNTRGSCWSVFWPVVPVQDSWSYQDGSVLFNLFQMSWNRLTIFLIKESTVNNSPLLGSAMLYLESHTSMI